MASSQPTRRGVTLTEVLITLAVLVVSAIIVWPVITGVYDISRLKSSADDLVAECAKARLDAMTMGQIYVLYFQPDTGSYMVQPLPEPDTFLETTVESVEGARLLAGGQKPIDWTLSDTLPEGVYFVAAENHADERAEELLGFSTEAPQGDPTSPPILFYPDGTTSSSTLILRDDSGRYVEIAFNGLDGTAKAGEPFAPESIGQAP